MLTHDMEQGTPEWFAARSGIPTASEFEKIITPTGKASTQADNYMNRLVAEMIVGHPVETFEGNSWTERGKELEEEAASFYAFQNEDVELETCGFCTDDKRTMGCSPDRLVGEDGLLEIKCPAPQTHVNYLLTRKLDQKYNPQLQGQLLVTGRKWVDIISYYPEMQPVIIRVERDAKYLATMRDLLEKFIAEKDRKVAEIKERYYGE